MITLTLPDIWSDAFEPQDHVFEVLRADEAHCEHCGADIPAGAIRLYLLPQISEPSYSACYSHLSEFIEQSL